MARQSIELSITKWLKDRSLIDNSDLNVTTMGGGSINSCFLIQSQQHSFFCKVNSAKQFPLLFEKEVEGLQAIAATGTIRTPAIIGYFIQDEKQVLLLEYIRPGSRTREFWELFGRQLAELHLSKDAFTGSHQFGFVHPNYMGALHQDNEPKADWLTFFEDKRLRPQVKLAAGNGLMPARVESLFDRLYDKLNGIFNREPPSLLHGDLWSGNFVCSEDAAPVLIDPAVYYGHRSMDLGMTTLFGGFDRIFYETYHHWYPLPSNHLEQWEICNLYPLLIHLNLFGSSYLPPIERVLRRFH